MGSSDKAIESAGKCVVVADDDFDATELAAIPVAGQAAVFLEAKMVPRNLGGDLVD